VGNGGAGDAEPAAAAVVDAAVDPDPAALVDATAVDTVVDEAVPPLRSVPHAVNNVIAANPIATTAQGVVTARPVGCDRCAGGVLAGAGVTCTSPGC
jgi:hypothetical protein